jgi:DNA repair protein RecO (recombination protein O)
MSLESARGLVLRTYPLTETSLIVHWLTRECGRLGTVGKGARRPKSPLRGRLDLFYLADFTFQRSRRSDLHPLREVALIRTWPRLRTDWAQLRQAAYCARLIEQTTERETPIPVFFERFCDLLQVLEQCGPRPVWVFAFEVGVWTELGVAPKPSSAGLSPTAARALARLESASPLDLTNLDVSLPTMKELDQVLTRTLVEQLGRVPPGRTEALALSGPLPDGSTR